MWSTLSGQRPSTSLIATQSWPISCRTPWVSSPSDIECYCSVNILYQYSIAASLVILVACVWHIREFKECLQVSPLKISWDGKWERRQNLHKKMHGQDNSELMVRPEQGNILFLILEMVKISAGGCRINKTQLQKHSKVYQDTAKFLLCFPKASIAVFSVEAGHMWSKFQILMIFIESLAN